MTQAVRKQKYTSAEYFALEQEAEYKSEFFDGEIFAMAGASTNHNRAAGNIYAVCNFELLNKPCEVFNSDEKVQLKQDQRYTYPDVSIVCAELEFAPGRNDTITNPTVIIEVLSPSTELYDRVKKFALYRALKSFEEYILVSQDTVRVECFYKESDKDGDKWIIGETYTSLDDVFKFHSLDLQIPLERIYSKVQLQPEPPDPEEEKRL